MLGFNPRGQTDSSIQDFALNQKGTRRERWRKMTCLVYVNVCVCVGVSTLWANLFFQTHLNYDHITFQGRDKKTGLLEVLNRF